MERQEQANGGDRAFRRRVPIPTTPPHPVPGGEYDRDGFLFKCPVESPRHWLTGVQLHALLAPYLRRRHGDRVLVTGDCGLYARPADRHAKPLAADLLVSLTAGAVGAPGTPAEEDRLSYKLWQEPVPDLAVEVVSKSSGKRDTVDKPNRYEAMRIPEYWIFDPLRFRIADGLRGRLLGDDGYRNAKPCRPGAEDVPLPVGVVGYWSEVLRLYLYVDGKELVLHDPGTGRLRDLGEEVAAREAAEAAREAAEARVAALEAELRTLRPRQ